MQPDAAARPEIVAILTVGITGNAVPIYDAARLMRHALGGHERPICGEANARFNPVIAAA